MTETKPAALLPVGARIRHRRYPELTGRVQNYEYHQSGALSPIPYNIAWDNNSHAADVLGWFFIYAGDESVEAMAS